MVDRLMTQKDVINELKKRTGYNKKDLRVVFEVLDDIIVENMNTATYDEPSEIILFRGWRLGAKRVPDREWREPRYGKLAMTPEKLIPYCKLKQSFRQRINKFGEDDYVDESSEDFEYDE